MTFVAQHNTGFACLKLDIAAAIYAVMQRYDDYRAYRETLNQLRDLDDRQLADLGISRSEIAATAHKAAFGV
ncbi:DUF1127 domain-containing protein [Roseovarius faecimaris]|uniref:DUF1127 domain-containing protein n=1 Tax=Roseovarius faecimaris TaxID=2494550 RepID=A0A6I6IQH4_9RHOB|nr:DUF1127 domain-containing protein [Roseovarius faecimaris]QGX98945.1 DUF1127 domain-containing protein [Roseovarius faecimaris]